MNFKDNIQVQKLVKAFDLEIIDYKMDNNRNTEHKVKHSFKEEIIVPIHAVSSNMDFICCKGQKIVHMSDNVVCECTEWKELHLLAMDDEVERLYHISAWDLAKKWFSFDPKMVSMTFIYMKLRKI